MRNRPPAVIRLIVPNGCGGRCRLSSRTRSLREREIEADIAEKTPELIDEGGGEDDAVQIGDEL